MGFGGPILIARPAEPPEHATQRDGIVGPGRRGNLVFDDLDTQELHRLEIDGDTILGMLRGLHDDRVDTESPCMGYEGLHMARSIECLGLAFLHPRVAHEDTSGWGLLESGPDTGHQEGRYQAREEASGPEDDLIRIADRLDRGRVRSRIWRFQIHSLDRRLAPGNLYLALDLAPVDSRHQGDELGRGRVDAPHDRQQIPCSADRFYEITGGFSKSRYHQVPDRVPGERTGRETVLEQHRELLMVRQGYETVADIAGRGHAQVTCQPARRTTIVGNGHHRFYVVGVGAGRAQRRGESMASSDPYNLHGSTGGRSTSRWITDAPKPLSSMKAPTASANTTDR